MDTDQSKKKAGNWTGGGDQRDETGSREGGQMTGNERQRLDTEGLGWKENRWGTGRATCTTISQDRDAQTMERVCPAASRSTQRQASAPVEVAE